ncbi:MAG: hypothetical protein INH41_04255 [Myxococcaceae bacterium]|nr:hypothetical protein [Myxococcaceae bacterium]MCA3011595.1 hypothetical protein [Myxococcaceae bacterium]
MASSRGIAGRTRVTPRRAPAAAEKQKPRTAEAPKRGWAPRVPRLALPSLQPPDFKHDGKVVDVKTGKASDFSLEALRGAVYTPRGAEGRAPLIFTEGANQWMEVGAERARRHADRLGLPLAIVHNASFVKEYPGQNQVLQKLSRAQEGLANVLLNKNLVSERSVKNLSTAMLDAVETGKPAYFGGESQGSILVGQAVGLAKQEYLKRHAPSGSKADVAKATAAWEKAAGASLNVVTFGNAYDKYPGGPNYLHVMMKGDPVPGNGSRPDNRPPDAKTQYLVFDQLFAGKNNFENHNIVFLTELVKRTSELNGLPPGDLPALFAASQKAQREGRSLVIARPDDVRWPSDMQSLVWDQKNDVARSLAAWKAAAPAR